MPQGILLTWSKGPLWQLQTRLHSRLWRSQAKSQKWSLLFWSDNQYTMDKLWKLRTLEALHCINAASLAWKIVCVLLPFLKWMVAVTKRNYLSLMGEWTKALWAQRLIWKSEKITQSHFRIIVCQFWKQRRRIRTIWSSCGQCFLLALCLLTLY